MPVICLAIMDVIDRSEAGALSARYIADRFSVTYARAWSLLDRLSAEGLASRDGGQWRLTDVGRRTMRVLWGLPAVAVVEDQYPPGWEDAAE